MLVIIIEPDIISDFLCSLESSFAVVKSCLDNNDFESSLQGSVAHSTFKRLN